MLREMLQSKFASMVCCLSSYCKHNILISKVAGAVRYSADQPPTELLKAAAYGRHSILPSEFNRCCSIILFFFPTFN